MGDLEDMLQMVLDEGDSIDGEASNGTGQIKGRLEKIMSDIESTSSLVPRPDP